LQIRLVLERFVQRGSALGAWIVIVSTLLGPITCFYWGNLLFQGDHQLYFVWGIYSLDRQRIIPYNPLMNPIDPSEIFLLVTLWLVCGFILVATMLYSSLEKHSPVIVWTVLAFVLILQIVLPFVVLPITDLDKYPYSVEWTGVLASYPFPAVLAIAAQSVLHLIQSKIKRQNTDGAGEGTRTPES